ncbi:MAG TPA: glycerate kinase [Bryobacteraceae bacterium]|nr:glycerate kinase [Bryobacteraceae bacterium]
MTPITKLRKQALRIWQAALKAADPYEAVLRFVEVSEGVLIVSDRRYKLSNIDRIFVVGGGKASAPMARAVEKRLGKRITGGLLNTKYGHGSLLKRITLQESAHPVPDEAGLEGTRRMLKLLQDARKDDLVICLVSGGASALMPLPAPPVTLEEKQEVTRQLLRSGATIHEINAVRKHLSLVKGGQLAAAASPARVITLALSDVIGDDLDVIGSGITVPDSSTFGDALRVLENRGVWGTVPPAVRERIEKGAEGLLPETPKPGDPIFEKTQTVIVGSNRMALEAAQREAKALGLRSLILSSSIDGETCDVAGVHVAIAREMEEFGAPLKPPACLISGGETTVTMKGDGKGGRNQEFALAAALGIEGMQSTVVLSAGTDGTDGPTDAAGAIVDGGTIARARGLGLEPEVALRENDSYPLLDASRDLIKTGPTGTNVMDVRLVLVGARLSSQR